MRVKRARSEEGVLFALAHGDVLSAQLPAGWVTGRETDVERYLLGHAGKDIHAGYGEQWIKTLRAAIEVILNRLAVWAHLMPLTLLCHGIHCRQVKETAKFYGNQHLNSSSPNGREAPRD